MTSSAARSSPAPLRPRRVRPVACGIDRVAAEDAPGAVLPPAVAHALARRLRALHEAQGRARLAANSYWIG